MKTARAESRRLGSSALLLLLLTFFAVSVMLPLASMLTRALSTDISALLRSPRFAQAIKNSLLVSLTATVISVTLASALAYCLNRVAMKGVGIFSVLLSLPMLIPSISHGMGLVVLLGRNGILTNLLSLNVNIYGFWGIVLGSVLYSAPVAFIMVSDILSYQDATADEACEVLGIPKASRFFSVTLPYMAKPMISIFFAVFTLIITDYGVALTVGGKFVILPVLMYQDVLGLLDFGKGAFAGAILLLPAFAAFVIDLLTRKNAQSSFAPKPFVRRGGGLRKTFAYLLCSLSALCVLLPIGSFAVLTFVKKYPVDMSLSLTNIARTFSMRAGEYFAVSLLMAFFTALLGASLSVVCAYCAARMDHAGTKLLHMCSLLTMSIPGLVLGLSYVLFFSQSFLYGTLAILVLVNTIHFFSSPYLMAYNTFGKLNQSLEDVGQTLGIGRVRMFFDVLLVQARGTLAEMLGYFFVNSMMTISAVSFLATLENQPLSLMINKFEAQMMLECSAFVSLIILSVNLLLKGLIYLYKRRISK